MMDALVRGAFNRQMKSLGLRRAGRSYSWGASGQDQGLINLQTSSASDGIRTIFYVNVAIRPRAWSEFGAWLRGRPATEITVHSGIFNLRLPSAEPWAYTWDPGDGVRVSTDRWQFSLAAEAQGCAHALLGEIEGKVLPAFALMAEPEAFIDATAGMSPALPVVHTAMKKSRAMLVSVLLAERGPSSELQDAWDELDRTEENPRLVRWSRERASQWQ